MKINKESRSNEQEAAWLKEFYETGNLEVLGKLYEPYMFLVYGLCLKYLKDTTRSEDAVMQIFELLIKKLRMHRVDNFKAWLYTVARNHCLMQLRSMGKQPEVGFDENFMESELFLHLNSNDNDHEEQLQKMEGCIEQLNEEQKVCVRLFYLEEKCYKEISEITSYSMNQVKSYIQNGKRNLKICMDKNI